VQLRIRTKTDCKIAILDHDARVNWTELRLVLAVLREGNLKAAARALDMDYTTAWRQVRALEGRVGTRLFVRLRGSVRPTQTGRALAEKAAQIERLIASAHAIGATAQEAIGEIRLTTADMLLSSVVLPILRTLGRQAPELHVAVESSPLRRSIARLEADAAIRLGEANKEEVLVGLGRIGYGAYATGEVAARCAGRSVEAWPMLVLPRAWSTFTTMAWLSTHAPTSRPVGEFDTMISLAEAVEAGLGVGLLPHCVAVRSGRLVTLSLPVEVESSALSLVYHPDMRNDARIRALLRAARFEARERRALWLNGSAPSALRAA
jgi:DNA-binding transcriptional LysR family regulator